ncbi:sensor histidine kinase [Leuconostoc pseudomesenteroides]|uniref:sensor histidine kinase n=1 Tax=Leuconostoc pseudomesenteroides TaxID=33968 RepID=UPI00301D890B
MEKNINNEIRANITKSSKWPLIIWSVIMFVTSFFLIKDKQAFHGVNISIFLTLLFLQTVINFGSVQFIRVSKLVYIGSQIIVIIFAGILIAPGETVLYMSMLPVIGVQIISLFGIKLKTLLLILAPAQIAVIVIQLVNNGIFLALMALEASVFLNVVVFLAWQFYHRQVSQMIKTQHILQELQVTYTEVKEMSQQKERDRIGRELHDTLMQGLAGVTMQLEGIKALILKDKIDRAVDEIDKTITLSRSSLVEARTAVYEMRRDKTKNIDLYDRLDKLAKVFYENYGLSVNVKASAIIKLPQETLEEVMRIISEALTNVVKHSKTDFAIVKIDLDDFLNIEIIDYGAGFNVAAGERKKQHFGLHSIYERVQVLQGEVTIDSHVGEGTRVKVKIPQKLRWQNE